MGGDSAAVYIACNKGFEKIALMLIENGANINIPSKLNQCLLHIASINELEK